MTETRARILDSNGLEVQLHDHRIGRIMAEGSAIGRRQVRRGCSGVGDVCDRLVGGGDVKVVLNLSSSAMEGVHCDKLALPSECSHAGTLHGRSDLGLGGEEGGGQGIVGQGGPISEDRPTHGSGGGRAHGGGRPPSWPERRRHRRRGEEGKRKRRREEEAGWPWRWRRGDWPGKDAISKALGSRDVFLLHGPPGTGKTTTIIEIILQEVKRGSKILACAASNIAVDNIVERLARYRTKLVRLGHPARLLPQVLDSALDAQVLRADNSSLAGDIRKEMKVLNSKLLKAKDRNTKRDIRKELKTLAKEERKRQQLAITDVLKNANVVLTTLTGASSKKLNGITFDLVIIDEAAQALEVACWMALLKGPRCILAGDHLQLPPTIQSVEAEKKGMGKTLFERLTEAYGEEITSMLTIQYRMHDLIMNWSSKELYNNKIRAHSSVAGHMLYDLEEVKHSSSTEPTIILIDTTGCDMEEVKDEEESTMNEGEAAVSIAHAKLLVESGVHASDIGIITPYAAQVTCLKMMRNKDVKLKDLEISTVDGFQGREKEAIIISMVRSNSKKEVGFLSDHRRMNVAVTRARRQCCLVCDVETVSNDKFLKRLVEYFEENGEYLSASEYERS
ncbi:hypothetical protein PR202_gb11870 [Eleusine coracana subsp. coracana]|uniref:DNA-binding protein SMUBP-2 n=1 Tax=Eleusine coracana subsp. coracana TaxID=191504 RepID=A0AAV5ELC0_ELECO|nr:hypothetical protein PR202_gb11870 [Eleusine coracana subsp. coracana]